VSHYIPFDQVDQVFENIIHPPKDMKKMVILFDGCTGTTYLRKTG
jgi:L-gulonate 5-dehydrogenase